MCIVCMRVYTYMCVEKRVSLSGFEARPVSASRSFFLFLLQS